MGTLAKGLLFVVSAPAGTGKTTLVQMLVDELPKVVMSVSYTTRSPRPGEIAGKHYNFISEDEFKKKIADGDFLEYAQIYGFYYGTSKKWVAEQQAKGKHVVLVIDTQGGLQLKGRVPAVFIFITPPSLEVLRERLTNRKTESQEVIEQRLNWSKKEINDAQYYDYQIINDDLDTAYQVLKDIVIAEEHRIVHG